MSEHAAARPAIPATCESRPIIGGLVIPWINVQLADGGVDFRAQHDSRAQRCYLEGLCQVCSTPIERPPFVLIGGPRQLTALQFEEPPLHPECAAYVTHACPMVAGRMLRFADRDPISESHRGTACPDPECDCGGWVPTPGAADRELNGRPAHDWYAVYATTYAFGATPDGQAHSALLSPDHVRAVRHVSTPGAGRTWKRISLDEVIATNAAGGLC